jgi:hypothetical protein
VPSGRVAQCFSFVPQPCTSAGHLLDLLVVRHPTFTSFFSLPAVLARSQRRHSQPLAPSQQLPNPTHHHLDEKSKRSGDKRKFDNLKLFSKQSPSKQFSLALLRGSRNNLNIS